MEPLRNRLSEQHSAYMGVHLEMMRVQFGSDSERARSSNRSRSSATSRIGARTKAGRWPKVDTHDSAYLRQHASNPVAWQPWDERALAGLDACTFLELMEDRVAPQEQVDPGETAGEDVSCRDGACRRGQKSTPTRNA